MNGIQIMAISVEMLLIGCILLLAGEVFFFPLFLAASGLMVLGLTLLAIGIFQKALEDFDRI